MSSKAMPTLLGIPVELRFQIYDEVLKSDIDYNVLKEYTGEWSVSKRGFLTQPVRNKDARLDVPWLNLLATCSSIQAELSSHMRNSGPTTGGSKTYKLDLTIDGSMRGDVGAVTWRQLPCAPNETEILDVNCRLKTYHLRFWGDGGPRNIVRSLYQLLNSILHCGPLLDTSKPLTEHMRLREIVIYFTFPTSEPEDDGLSPWSVSSYEDLSGSERKKRKRREGIGALHSLVDMVCGDSILERYVEQFRVVWDDGDEKIVAPTRGGSMEVPGAWDGYGFEWGVEREQE